MKRVLIIGCPGSGKTTFAQKLAPRTGLPLIHLDFYYHQTKRNYYNDSQAWLTQVKKLAQQDSWIIDGNYNSTMEVRLKQADTVFFYDFPRYKSLYGVIKRGVKRHNRSLPGMPPDWKERLNLKFLKFVWAYRKNNRSDTIQAIDTYGPKEIVTFTNHRQAKKYIAVMDSK